MNISLKRSFEKITRKISNILSFGEVLESKNGALKIIFGEDDFLEGLEVLSPYGFKSIPRKGASCTVISSGSRNASFVLASDSENIEKKSSKIEGSVELLDGEGASIGLFRGDMRLTAKNIFVKNSKEDLTSLNLELLGIFGALLTSGNTPQGPVLFSPEIKAKIEILKNKWGPV